MEEQIATPTQPVHTDTEYHSEGGKVSPTALSMSTSIHILIRWVDVVDVEEIDRITTRQIKQRTNKNPLKRAVMNAGNHLPRLQSLQTSDQFPEEKYIMLKHSVLLAADFTSISRLTTPVERLLGFFFL